MVDVANYAADVHGDREFLGTRPLLKVHPAEGGLELYELGRASRPPLPPPPLSCG